MTGIIAIDESGDLGKNGTRFFVLSAIMSNRSRNLLHTSKLIINKDYENKYKNTSGSDITVLLNRLSKSNAVITYVVVDKYDFNSTMYNIYGNDLYLKVIKQLFISIDKTSPSSEVNILIDRTPCMTQNNLRKLCDELISIKVKKSTLYDSYSNKCIQIADYVAGSIWHMYERNEFEHFSIIQNMIRRP